MAARRLYPYKLHPYKWHPRMNRFTTPFDSDEKFFYYFLPHFEATVDQHKS